MKIAVLGCGVMGSAFARQLAQKGHQLVLCDRNSEKEHTLAKEIGAVFASDPREAIKGVDVIVLAIKPKDIEKIAAVIGKLEGQMLVSIVVSYTVASLKKLFPGGEIIRTMPNLALTRGESVIAVVKDEKLLEVSRKKVDLLLDGMGLIFWTEEGKIDAISALAGSGPAFVIAIIEAMIESGVMMGLKASEAKELVLQTLLGSVALLKSHEGHPGEIRWQISAPAGTTIAGMKALEEGGVRSGVMNTILATYRRTKELG